MKYDLIIIGGGPAGLTAAIYAARYKLKILLITKILGGIALTAHKICNFPTYQDVSGLKLMKQMEDHVKNLKVPIINDEVIKISKGFKLKTKNKTYEAKKIILALGTERRKLNLLNENKFLGHGISYCATCDAMFYKNKDVAVIGGSNSALTAALLLAEYANQVYIIYRKDHFFRADPAWVEQVEKNKKIKTIFNEQVTELKGEKFLEGVKLKNQELKVQGLFIEIGSIPDTKLSSQLNIKTDSKSYIITDKQQRTSIEGVYAAGDITNNSLKQIITACGQGAIAAYTSYQELNLSNKS